MRSTAVVPSDLSPRVEHRPPAPDDGDGGEGSGSVGYRIRRLKATALRYKYLVGALVLTGALGGYFGRLLVAPVYTASATILVSRDASDQDRGPIREAGVLESSGWIDVLRSSRVVDSVVLRTGYHIRGTTPEDRSLLASASTTSGYVDGGYKLIVEPNGQSYQLVTGKDEVVVQSGTLPDSIGGRVGLRWLVPQQPGAREVPLYVARVRDASEELVADMRTFAPERAQFVTVELDGEDPARTTTVLNAWLDEFVRVAGDLKRRRAGEYMTILEQQVQLTQDRLRTAEGALETLRATTITSTDGGGPIAGGLESTRDPLMREFLTNRVGLEEVRRDREALTQMLREPAELTAERLSALPAVLASNAALREALNDLATREAKLRSQRQFYGDEHPSVRDLMASIDALKRQALPQLARSAADQLAYREQSLTRSLSTFSSELRRVPERSIEEARRRREVEVADGLYRSVLERYNEARLGAAALGADVQVFDYARASRYPSQNPRRRVLVGGLGAGLALAAALVFLLDLADRRLRYAEQVTGDLRLEILGHVPRIGPRASRDPIAAAQTVEAFRSLRLRLQNDAPRHDGFAVVLTSPDMADGKSLVSQNLALSCAQAGLKTLLIDGDIRRGKQHVAFNVEQVPGLVDVLERDLDPGEAIVPTGVDNLSLLPTGSRHVRVPELLDRDKLQRLFDRVRGEYAAVIIDSAPLGAGIDAFALGVACGTMALVLRMDQSNARTAAAHLDVLDRLPVRVIGAILNDVSTRNTALYTPYYAEYMLTDDAAPSSRRPSATPPKGTTPRLAAKG